MKIEIRFDGKPPITVDGAWQVVIEHEGKCYEIIPQRVDRAVAENILLRTLDIGDRLKIVPHGSNSILFGGSGSRK